MVDYAFALLFDLHMDFDGQDVTFWIVLFFALNFGLLGFVIGRLWLRKQELVNKQNELVRTQERLIEHEKLAAIGRVAASVAHEVRNPLGVIKSSAGLIEEDLSEYPDAKTAAQYITSEVDRLDVFVSELLTYAKPFESMTERQDLQPWVDSLQSLQTTEVEIAAVHTDATATFSPVLLTQLVHALVENAKRYGSRISVEVVCSTTLSISVFDDGESIAIETVPHLFEPFFTTRAKGTGLGLATAKKIAEAHQGTLRYQANPKAFIFEMKI